MLYPTLSEEKAAIALERNDDRHAHTFVFDTPRHSCSRLSLVRSDDKAIEALSRPGYIEELMLEAADKPRQRALVPLLRGRSFVGFVSLTRPTRSGAATKARSSPVEASTIETVRWHPEHSSSMRASSLLPPARN